MIKNKKVLLAAVLLTFSMAATAWAAPDKFSVQADEMEYDLQTGDGTAKGHVVLTQNDGRATANEAVFNSKTKSGTLIGNVVADRGDAHIVCDKFIAHNENDMSAVGSAVITKQGKSLSADQVNYFKVREYAETVGSWAKMTDVDGSVLNASRIDYDIKNGVAKAYGGVTVDSPARDLTASADNAVYETKADGTIQLLGNAKATQNGNSVAGDKLLLKNTNVAVADGNVVIHYTPEKQPAAGSASEQQKEQGIVKEEEMATA